MARLKFHCAEMFGAITAQCSFSSSEKPASETAKSYFDDGNVPPFSNAPRRASLIIVERIVSYVEFSVVLEAVALTPRLGKNVFHEYIFARFFISKSIAADLSDLLFSSAYATASSTVRTTFSFSAAS